MAEVLPEVLEAAGGEEALGVVGRFFGRAIGSLFGSAGEAAEGEASEALSQSLARSFVPNYGSLGESGVGNNAFEMVQQLGQEAAEGGGEVIGDDAQEFGLENFRDPPTHFPSKIER